jgi:hypothetical protein
VHFGLGKSYEEGTIKDMSIPWVFGSYSVAMQMQKYKNTDALI